MAKAIHTMIRVLDEARSLAFYKGAFGLDIADRLDFPDFTLVYLSNSETPYELELTINKDRTEPYNLGDGYGHVAFVIEDLDAEQRRFEAEGTWRLIFLMWRLRFAYWLGADPKLLARRYGYVPRES